ncbi:MAG: leucine-rich repeat protein, partial [Ruminococcus sp.]|nr:leucine-rich repeat protein [Ruminococcus sp.]
MMAFYGNAAVTSLTIPSTVKYIGAGAFCEMSALKSVKINAPLERLEDGTFFI